MADDVPDADPTPMGMDYAVAGESWLHLLDERISNYQAMRDERVEAGRDENGYALVVEALELFRADALNAHSNPSAYERGRAFQIGDRVEKVGGSSWRGNVVGTYSTTLTPEGYAVESEREPGSVQIYPAKALRCTPAELDGGAR